MPIASVSAVEVRSDFATSVTTGNLATTTGNLLIADQTWGATGTWASITDNQTNTWGAVHAEMADGDTQTESREDAVVSCTGSATHTFTLTLTGNNTLALIVSQVSGHNTASALDEIAVGTELLATTHTTADTAATDTAAEYLHGFAANSGFRDFSVSAPWTQLHQQTNQMVAYQIVAATGQYAFTTDTSAGLSGSATFISTWRELDSGSGQVGINVSPLFILGAG